MRTTLHVSVQEEEAKTLKAEAARQDRSVSWIIKEAIRHYIAGLAGKKRKS